MSVRVHAGAWRVGEVEFVAFAEPVETISGDSWGAITVGGGVWYLDKAAFNWFVREIAARYNRNETARRFEVGHG